MQGSMESDNADDLECVCSTITTLVRSKTVVDPASRHISTAGRTCMGCAEGRTPGYSLDH